MEVTGRRQHRRRPLDTQCKYVDPEGKVCITKGRSAWGGFCYRHRHHDATSEEKLASIEVRKITGQTYDQGNLREAHKTLMECIEMTQNKKMEPDTLAAISKAVLADCEISRVRMEGVVAKHKIMVESKRHDPGSPFKFLDIPTVEALQQVDQSKEIEEIERDAKVSVEAATQGPSIAEVGQGQPPI